MVHPELEAFLAGPRFAALAYLRPDGRPTMTRAAGWRRGPEGGPDLVFVIPRRLNPHLPGEGSSDRLAVAMGRADQFESYQVKGRARTRPATAEEVADGLKMMGELGRIVEANMGLPARLYESIPMTVEGAVAVELFVEDCFRQSPGPGAGARMGAS